MVSLFRKPKVIIGSATDRGLKRKNLSNQDSLSVIRASLLTAFPILLVVADGMGGYSGGEIASGLVVKAFRTVFRKNHKGLSDQKMLELCVLAAYQAVCQRAGQVRELETMGSTVVGVVVREDQLTIVNVGDSRAYLFEGSEVIPLSSDQSVVADMVRRGELTVEEARHHPQRNQLSMSINARRKEVKANLASHSFSSNGVLLLCSDGLWGSVPETLIRATACQLPPQQAAEKLIALANANGGEDNISVVVARLAESVLEKIEGD